MQRLLAIATLTWKALNAQIIEIHVGSPSGPLFTQFGFKGSATTGAWVRWRSANLIDFAQLK